MLIVWLFISIVGHRAKIFKGAPPARACRCLRDGRSAAEKGSVGGGMRFLPEFWQMSCIALHCLYKMGCCVNKVLCAGGGRVPPWEPLSRSAAAIPPRLIDIFGTVDTPNTANTPNTADRTGAAETISAADTSDTSCRRRGSVVYYFRPFFAAVLPEKDVFPRRIFRPNRYKTKGVSDAAPAPLRSFFPGRQRSSAF